MIILHLKKWLIQKEKKGRNIDAKFSEIKWLNVKANPQDDCWTFNNSIIRGSFDN
jgi:hypothetical protein